MNLNTINDARTVAGNAEGTLLANRYRVVRQLGQGGMGSVWLAEDTQLDNKPFAIKMLPAILVSNKRAYRQLKDEALVAMQLVHPNIVQIRAFEENNGNPFLVMDYVDGQTLDDYLAENGKLYEDEVLRVLRPIAAALDYAHGEGVVHRDVKPANVMIRKDGHPFILDFGIAREIQETMTRVTGKLSSGTLLYMSPEQLNGERPTPAQDIYSFAAMVYECLKGEPPFVRGAIEDQIKNKQPEPLELPTGGSSARGSGTLAASVMSGLAKKPENRPVSCTAVLEGRITFNAPQSGGRASPRAAAGEARLSRPNERKSGGVWKVLFAVALLALVGVGGGVWYHLQELKHEREAVESKAEEKRRKDEQVAQQKVSANEKKNKAENVLVKLQNEGAQDYGGESFKNIVALHAAGTNAFSRGMYADASKKFDEIINTESACKQAIGQAKKQERERTAKFVQMKEQINIIKTSRAKSKMKSVDKFRSDTDGLSAHIKSADRQWTTILALLEPKSLKEAEAALNIATNADTQISLDLNWLKENKAGRDAAKAAADKIDALLNGDAATFKAKENASKVYGEGLCLCNQGDVAFSNGEFAKARSLREQSEAKFASAVKEAKSLCIKTTLELAKGYLESSKWNDCIAECDKVLRWDSANKVAKQLKADAEEAKRRAEKEARQNVAAEAEIPEAAKKVSAGIERQLPTENNDDNGILDEGSLVTGVPFDQDPDYVHCTDVTFVPVYFGFDDASILQSSELPKIDAVAKHLKRTGRVVIVEGNCEERGSNEYSISFAESLANVIRNHLVKLGVDPAKIQTRSHGEENPAVAGHGEGAWRKNRRCEFVVLSRFTLPEHIRYCRHCRISLSPYPRNIKTCPRCEKSLLK